MLSVYIWFNWELSRTKWEYHQNYLFVFNNNQQHVWNKTYFILIKDFVILFFIFTYLTTIYTFNSWYFNFYQIRHVSVYRFSWVELKYVADQAESCRSFSVGRPTRNPKQKLKQFSIEIRTENGCQVSLFKLRSSCFSWYTFQFVFKALLMHLS